MRKVGSFVPGTQLADCIVGSSRRFWPFERAKNTEGYFDPPAAPDDSSSSDSSDDDDKTDGGDAPDGPGGGVDGLPPDGMEEIALLAVELLVHVGAGGDDDPGVVC